MKYDMEQWIDKYKGSVIEYHKILEYQKPEYFMDGDGSATYSYEDEKKEYGILQDAICLGNGKWLLGLNDISEIGQQYYGLHDIHYLMLDRISICIRTENQKILDSIIFVDDSEANNS